jgi:putative nucleotidyltransferase with HDIG domain
MQLRAKTALIIGGVITALMLVIYALLAQQNTFETLELEHAEMSRNLVRASNAISNELDQLETMTLDWAVWDEAFDYARGRSDTFEDQNLGNTSLRILELDRLVLRSNTNVLTTRQRTEDDEYITSREPLGMFINPDRWLWSRTGHFIVTSGIVLQDDQYYLVAQSPIIPSSYFRPSAGTVTMVRALDREALLSLSQLTQLSINVYRNQGDTLETETRASVEQLLGGVPQVVQPISEARIAGFSALSTRGLQPVLFLRVETNRDVYQKNRAELWRLGLSLLGIAAAMIGLTLALLEWGLLSRLAQLSRELFAVAKSGDSSQRVTVRGSDELGQVASNVNLGLQRIEESQVKTAQLEIALHKNRNVELESTLEATRLELFERLALVAEFRDSETVQHTNRVGNWAAAIARKLNLTEAERLSYAARLHDIGKIAIPDAVLFKPSSLSPEEWKLMQTHATLGAQMLEGSDSPLLEMAKEIALTHHERWGGNGYPRGLIGEDIPLVGRIVAVADAFDAMITTRPYKSAWTPEKALNEIRACSGTQFDPNVVRAFLEVFTAQNTVAAND